MPAMLTLTAQPLGSLGRTLWELGKVVKAGRRTGDSLWKTHFATNGSEWVQGAKRTFLIDVADREDRAICLPLWVKEWRHESF
jgi:hypothetical protein